MRHKIIEILGAGHPWAGSVRYFDTIGSTNDEAKMLANSGAPHGTVLVADMQTGGRGRMGRSFHSPSGTGIYLSVVLRPQCRAEDLMHLTCAAAVGVCDAIESVTGFRPGVKWINDLVANGKKLGGILTELSLNSDGSVRYAVVGIGINCNRKAFPKELENIATCLQSILGQAVSREELMGALIRETERISRRLFADKKEIMDTYKQNCVTLGQPVKVFDSHGIRSGMAIDLQDDGQLVVQFENGSIEAVGSGEVSVRGFFGYC